MPRQGSDIAGEVAAVSAAMRDVEPSTREARDAKDKARRAEALTLRMAGLSDEQIAERMNMTESGARQLIERTLTRAVNQSVAQDRQLENLRLDRAQAAIWPDVLKGDLKAINTYLKISSERSKLNGLYAPTKIDLGVSIRSEMERALADLEQHVEEIIVDAEVVEDEDEGLTT
jgi:DNA-binding CsgD family transcriptional regulator